MLELLNVLYVLTQGAVLRLDHDTVRIEADGKTLAQIPLIRLSAIVIVGRVSVSTLLVHKCAEDGRSIVWLDSSGRFKARLQGPTSGNVLLRRAQHLALSDAEHTWRLARQFVAAKIQNCRQVLARAAREATSPDDRIIVDAAAERLADILLRLQDTRTLDEVRGTEGEAARIYFEAFGRMVRVDRSIFSPDGRSKRPPRDPMNALLSFLYALLRTECVAALEAVGLDPQIGYLHALRPGRPALALDLMEELRPLMADRLALTLVNRRQIRSEDFEFLLGGAVQLTDQGRRSVIAAYQRRKEEPVRHRVLQQKVPLGLLPHVQARLLARHLRDGLVEYPPFLYR